MTNDLKEWKYIPLTPRELEVCSLGAVLPATLQKYKIEYQKAYDHIAELQKRLDEYEERVERLKKKERDTYTSLAEQYEFGWEKALETAIEIMTGEDGDD